MVGWYSLTPAHVPIPASFVLSFWFLGCFLMAAKRFGERRFLPDPQAAARYRRSLRFYTEQSLLCAMICSLVAFSFLLGFFCMKYGVDAVLVLPFILVWASCCPSSSCGPGGSYRLPTRRTRSSRTRSGCSRRRGSWASPC